MDILGDFQNEDRGEENFSPSQILWRVALRLTIITVALVSGWRFLAS